jgi:hypothetical protein
VAIPVNLLAVTLVKKLNWYYFHNVSFDGSYIPRNLKEELFYLFKFDKELTNSMVKTFVWARAFDLLKKLVVG